MQEDFQTGSDGTDVTIANSAFDATDYNAASMQFSTTLAIKQTQSAKIALDGVSARASLRSNYRTGSATASYRWYQFVDALNANTIIGSVTGATGLISQLRINSDRTVRIYNATVAGATSVVTVPLQQWIRVEWQINASTGTQSLQIYTGGTLHSNQTGDALISLSAVTPSGTTISHMNVGVTASTINYTAYYDAFEATATGIVGADPAANASSSMTGQLGVAVDGVYRPVVRSAVGINGVWRPITAIAHGVSGTWRPTAGATAPPPPLTQSAKMPLYVSPTQDAGAGSSFMDAFESRFNAGWGTAFYTYWPGEIAWNSEWADFVARHPEGLPVLGSPKGTSPAAVNDFMQNLPQAWREKWVMAYFQEPEDNFTTSAQRADFRASVAEMAALVRPYGVMNAVHLQEWAINPANNLDWALPDRSANLAEFVDPADIDYMSWSLYPAKGNSMQPGIDRIKAFSDTYAPGVPWGVTAAGSPVPGSDPIGGTDRATRAQIVRDAADYIAAQGGIAFGWFDFDEYNPGRDQLASKDPALQDALIYAANVELPGSLPWS